MRIVPIVIPLIKYRGKVIRMHPLFHPLYIEFCTYFNGNQDYFECHEVLEEYWKEIAPGEKKHPLVGYIQVATGLYHWRRGNFAGAERMLKNALRIFETEEIDFIFLEKIDFKQLLEDVQTSIQRITSGAPFEGFNVVIVDAVLHTLVQDAIKSLPDEDTAFLLNKHTLRDRSDVIMEREKNLMERGRG
jgi:uncharacterized protein